MMMDEICYHRRRLGLVVTVWVPSHRGIAMNAYADAAAKAYAEADIMRETRSMREGVEYVTGRTCVYRTQQDEHVWTLSDEHPYRQAKRGMQVWVRRSMGNHDITAGVKPEDGWTDVRRAVERGAMRTETAVGDSNAAEEGEAEGVTGERDKHSRYMDMAALLSERLGITYGWRVGHIEGVEGGVIHQRWLAGEKATQKPGRATYEEERGCVVGCGETLDVKHVVTMRCCCYTDAERRAYQRAIATAVQRMLKVVPKPTDAEMRTMPMSDWCKCRKQLVALECATREWKRTGVMSEHGVQKLRQVVTGNLYEPRGASHMGDRAYQRMCRTG